MSPRSFAIAAGHSVTAEAARSILAAGGNAFDAAAAGLAASFMAEPLLSSAGGGGFLLAHPEGERDVVYDFFVQTPRNRRMDGEDFREAIVDFGGTSQGYHVGWGSIATPGALAGLFAFQRDLGRMPMAEVLAPALDAGRQGVQVTPLQARILDVLNPIHQHSPETRDLFSPAGNRLVAGSLHRLPDLADLLETMAIEGVDLFYRGEVAEQIDARSRAEGGHLRREDLETYEVMRRAPLVLMYHGVKLWTNPPPASGGVLVGTGLHQMTTVPTPATRSACSPDWGRALARVLTETDEIRRIDGLDFPEHLEKAAQQMAAHPRAFRGTTHLSMIDGWGNGAALSISNGEGCGHAIAGTGIMLNNMLGELDLQPRGLGAWTPNIRLTSMMAPTRMVTPEGREILLGSGGSNRIRSALLRVILALIDLDLPIDEAIATPRLHVEDGTLAIEGGWPEETVAALCEGPLNPSVWPEANLFFGGVHAVARGPGARGPGGWEAAGDPRREGVGLLGE